MDSLNPDLNGTTCTAGGCFEVADVVGVVELDVPAELGYADSGVVLEVAVCVEHAHQLRSGGTMRSVRFPA